MEFEKVKFRNTSQKAPFETAGAETEPITRTEIDRRYLFRNVQASKNKTSKKTSGGQYLYPKINQKVAFVFKKDNIWCMVVTQKVNLHAKIREIRESEKLSRELFADMFGVPMKRIKDIEDKTKPDVELLVAICAKFNLSFRFFVISGMTYEEGLRLGSADELLDLLLHLPENHLESIRSLASAYAYWKDQKAAHVKFNRRFGEPS